MPIKHAEHTLEGTDSTKRRHLPVASAERRRTARRNSNVFISTDRTRACSALLGEVTRNDSDFDYQRAEGRQNHD